MGRVARYTGRLGGRDSVDVFAGPRAKVARAQHQIEALSRDLTAVLDGKDTSLQVAFRHDEYEGHPAIALDAVRVPTFGRELGIWIGEIVHNLRSALDHTAWLVVPPNQRAAERVARRVQFPYEREACKYADEFKHRLPGALDTVCTAVKDFQPFSPEPVGSSMRLLQELSNADKHRLILPTLFMPLGGRLELSFTKAALLGESQLLGRGEPLEPQQTLYQWWFDRIPSEVTLNGSLRSVPAFPPDAVTPRPGESIVEITGTLTSIAETCSAAIAAIERAAFSG